MLPQRLFCEELNMMHQKQTTYVTIITYYYCCRSQLFIEPECN